ncbi:cytochrome-c peroxidase [Flavobacterium sp. RHBU_3]|uniref:cytochrome-c peroxidase n=1 Tax=Flavobacterium sp. RHBU_3 TaxID=3391184 RepID=UPI0039847C24
MKKLLYIAVICLLAVAFGTLPDDEVYVPVPKNWPKPAYDFSGNPITKEKILLGRALFYDPLLSADGSVSCASCHSPYNAFTHTDHKVSHGIYDRIGTRNAPALQNLAWSTTFMWDGAVHHLDAQALAPIHNKDEMDETITHVVQKLNASQLYRGAFYRAYGDSIVTGTQVLKVMSQFMLTLVSQNAKYDKVMRSEQVFTESETKGYELFKQHCASCHKEPLFTNNGFENNGLQPDSIYKDGGRIKVTHREKDSLLFKVPSLRNVAVTYPYMHDGRFANLQMVLFHYTNGIYKSTTLSPRLKKPIVLSENDKRNLISFLKTLTDESFLHNKDNAYPKDFFTER